MSGFVPEFAFGVLPVSVTAVCGLTPIRRPQHPQGLLLRASAGIVSLGIVSLLSADPGDDPAAQMSALLWGLWWLTGAVLAAGIIVAMVRASVPTPSPRPTSRPRWWGLVPGGSAPRPWCC